MGPLDFIRRTSGLYVPPLIGFAGKLGRFQPCETCCDEPEFPCFGCKDDIGPEAWEITIGDIADWGCNDCENKNGIYIAERLTDCKYGAMTNDLCPGNTIALEIYWNGGISVRMACAGGNCCFWAFTKIPPPELPDCMAIAGEGLPLGSFFCAPMCGFGCSCHGEEATCSITAL